MEERIADALAARAEGHVGSRRAPQPVALTDEERDQLTSLVQVADRLQHSMHRVQPSPAFVRSLRGELVEEARRQLARRERRQRVTKIVAAVVGGVVSIASVVGGIVVLVKWLRTRTEARQAPAG